MGMLCSYVSMRAGRCRRVESGDTRVVLVYSLLQLATYRLLAIGYQLPATRKNERS
jgi:hypothetical protein